MNAAIEFLLILFLFNACGVVLYVLTRFNPDTALSKIVEVIARMVLALGAFMAFLFFFVIVAAAMGAV